jgi:hypothetical protein
MKSIRRSSLYDFTVKHSPTNWWTRKTFKLFKKGWIFFLNSMKIWDYLVEKSRLIGSISMMLKGRFATNLNLLILSNKLIISVQK